MLGSIVVALHRGAFEAPPRGVPAEALALARDTIGGAVLAARELAEPFGSELLILARCAFAQAFDASALVSACIAIAVAVLATMLRRAPRHSRESEHVDS